MANVTVSYLAIGQGNCSLIEIWEGASYAARSNLFIALIDCGSDDSMGNQNVIDSIATITTAMGKHSAGTGFTPPYLDILFVSHQDMDHWNKLDMILNSANGKRKINHGLRDIDTCIQTPAAIASINFSPVVATVLASQEQYSKWKVFVDTALYRGSQHLLIDSQNYYMAIEWSCIDIIKKQVSFKLEFEIDDPYLEISLSFGNDCSLGGWTFELENETYRYTYYMNGYTKKYELTKDFTIIKMDDSWKLTEAFQATLDELIKVKKLKIKSSTIVSLYTSYYNFLNKFTYEDVVQIINDKQDLKCYIGQAFIGGEEGIYSPSFIGMRDRIKAVCSTEVVQLIKNQKKHIIYFNRDWNMETTMLCCTELSNCKLTGAKSEKSIKNNASSAVALWCINNNKFLFPGDATVHTMYYMTNNNLLDDTTASIMLAPHHGSGTSSKVSSKKRGRNGVQPDPWAILERFLETIKPSEMIISAGINNTHGHPNRSFIAKSEKTLSLTSADPHNICYNVLDSGRTSKNYQRMDEKITLFTNAVYNQAGQLVYMNYNRVCSTITPTSAFVEPETYVSSAIEPQRIIELPHKELHRLQQKEAIYQKSAIDLKQVDFLESIIRR